MSSTLSKRDFTRNRGFCSKATECTSGSRSRTIEQFVSRQLTWQKHSGHGTIYRLTKGRNSNDDLQVHCAKGISMTKVSRTTGSPKLVPKRVPVDLRQIY